MGLKRFCTVISSAAPTGLFSAFNSESVREIVCTRYCIPIEPLVALTALAVMLMRSGRAAAMSRSNPDGISTMASTVPFSRCFMASWKSDVATVNERYSEALICEAMRREVAEWSRSTTATLTLRTSIVIISGIISIMRTGNATINRGRNELRRICRNSLRNKTLNVLMDYSSLSLNFLSETPSTKAVMQNRMTQSCQTSTTDAPWIIILRTASIYQRVGTRSDTV